MSAAVKNLAEKYYPAMWDKERLVALVEAGKLTIAEYEAVTGEKYEAAK